jgi:hypothetical protein
MSDETPETTNALHGVWYRGDHGSAIPALCRRLEIERDEARREAKKWRDMALASKWPKTALPWEG